MRNDTRWELSIIKSTGYAKTTVYRVVAKFDSEGKVKRSLHNLRKDPKRTKTFLARLKMSLKEDLTQLISKMAKRRNVSHRTISRAVNETFG